MKGSPGPQQSPGVRGQLRTSISSMVCTMNMSWRSSIALSIQLLKGAARLAYSRCSWSMVSSCFSVFWRVQERDGEVSQRASGLVARGPKGSENVPSR